MTSHRLIRKSRRAAGLTQAQLAQRLGISQPALARLERPGSNPAVSTLGRVLRATGNRLELRTRPMSPSIDDTLIAQHLRLTPQQRLLGLEQMYAQAQAIARAGEQARGRSG
jgi:transcriptional regulator with XRE-family HTH domain